MMDESMMDECQGKKMPKEPKTHVYEEIRDTFYNELLSHGFCATCDEAFRIASRASKMATGLVMAEIIYNLGLAKEDATVAALKKLMSADVKAVCGDKDYVYEGAVVVSDELK